MANSAEQAVTQQRPGEVDVAVLNIRALALGSELTRRAPWLEVAFWLEENDDAPAMAAARSLGIHRLIPLRSLTPWLEAALTSLIRMARARRSLMDAERELPPPPCPDSSGSIPLPEAERMFRETYLRRLLSSSSSAALAARRAGIPYTTLCSMVKKLNL